MNPGRPRGQRAADSGAALLDDVQSVLERFVVFPLGEHQSATLALWIVHTHCFTAFDTTPYLHVFSPEKGSGKSRLFEVLDPLVYRGWFVTAATEATVFRKLESDHPTLLLDEIDAVFGRAAELTQVLRGVLNAGYRRGATVPRVEGSGADRRVVDFEVYGPKAFAGIGATALPDTLVDRSIPIALTRRQPHERRPERFRQAQARAELLPLAERIAHWAQAQHGEIEQQRPELPDELSDRQQDAWEILLAVAHVAGGDWPERARRAALVLHGHLSADAAA
jgi:hypothetical protein